MARILLVDDEPAVRFALEDLIRLRGHDPVTAASMAEALDRLDGVDAVVSDLAMPGGTGLDLLAAVRARAPDVPVLLLTARGSERVAVQAIRAGAYDYLTKPFDIDELSIALERALEARQLRRDARRLGAERNLGQAIVGDSAALRAVVDAAIKVAARDVTVLVRGETGTGKELVAGLIHAASGRAAGPLIRWSCAAIPEELAEAELFGHAKGAFTGAVAARRGAFGQAHGGTLVLDEIGELPPALQPKLLRALHGEIQPVGAGPEKVDVRVVACTHRDLRAEVAAGRFREDLYYRLAVVELELPPLRARRVDVAPLIDELRRRHARRFGLDDVPWPRALVERLAAHDWPGNVRELDNVVQRLLALSDDGRVAEDAWPGPEASGAAAPAAPGDAAPAGRWRDELAAFERDLLERVLAATGGNHSAAARQLGITRTTLLDKLRRAGLR